MSLDDVLERAAASVRAVSVDVPDPAVVAGRRRRRPTGRAAAVVAVAATVVIAVVVVRSNDSQRIAVSDHQVATTTTGPVVPWVDGPPVTGAPDDTATSVVPPATAPACTNTDIDVSVGEPSTLPDGTGSRLFEFTNIGTAACSLTGRPSVSAVLDDGTRVAATAGQPGASIHGPDVTTTVIPVGEASLAALGFPGDCTSGVATTAEVSFGGAAVEVSLPRPAADPDGTYESGPGGLGEAVPTACGLQIGTFTVALSTVPGLSHISQLQYRATVPKVVTAGESLIVHLIVTNPTNRTIAFDPCPTYELQLTQSQPSRASASDRRELNCLAAADLPPGASTTFELHLQVGMDFSTGLAALSWMAEDTEQGAVPVPIDVVHPCETDTSVDRQYIGLTVAKAQTLAAQQGKTIRVVWHDDINPDLTADLVTNRLDISTRNEVVEQACLEQ